MEELGIAATKQRLFPIRLPSRLFLFFFFFFMIDFHVTQMTKNKLGSILTTFVRGILISDASCIRRVWNLVDEGHEYY